MRFFRCQECNRLIDAYYILDTILTTFKGSKIFCSQTCAVMNEKPFLKETSNAEELIYSLKRIRI
jgi:hypothetical protein